MHVPLTAPQCPLLTPYQTCLSSDQVRSCLIVSHIIEDSLTLKVIIHERTVY